jgi:hypothetical protein
MIPLFEIHYIFQAFNVLPCTIHVFHDKKNRGKLQRLLGCLKWIDKGS